MKKKKNKKQNSTGLIREMESLPQNIIPVGERVTEDKNIYIHQRVYAKIRKFALQKTENEHGGILVGRIMNEMGKENTIIEGFIEAKYNTATPTTLTFTHETWEHFHEELDRKYKGSKIVGWIHTHPNFGIFLSENDRFIQENFFADQNQVAYVVDPIQKEEGFFFWIHDKLERCPGFYLFDKNGVKIKEKPWCGAQQEEMPTGTSIGRWELIPMGVLLLLLLLQSFVTFRQAQQIERLEQDVADMAVILSYTMSFGGSSDALSVSDIADVIRAQQNNQTPSNNGATGATN